MAEDQTKSEESAKSADRTVIKQAIIAGLFALIGGLTTAVYQGINSMQLKEREFESTVILKAIETGDPEKSAKNLAFLIDVGIVKGKNLEKGKIDSILEKLKNKPEEAPVLPSRETPVLLSSQTTGNSPDVEFARIYMNAPQGAENDIKSLTAKLEALDYKIILNTRKTSDRQSKITVVYYYQSDEEEAKTLIETIKSIGLEVDPNPKIIKGNVRYRHFDVRL